MVLDKEHLPQPESRSTPQMASKLHKQVQKILKVYPDVVVFLPVDQ